MVRLLSKNDVAELLSMKDALEYVEEAYKQLTLGNALVPQRIAITDPAPGLTLVMPGIIGGEMNALATKIVSVYKQNPEKYNSRFKYFVIGYKYERKEHHFNCR